VIPGKTYTPEAILQIAWRRKWLIVIPTLLVAAVVVAVVQALPNLYRSETLILVVPQKVPESYVRSTVTTRIEDRLQSVSQQILSRTRLERIIQELNLYQNERQRKLMEDVVEQMRKDIDVEIVKGDAFRVSYKSEDPRAAMRVTERLASFFIDESLRDREVLAQGTDQFLEAQLEDARRRLVENEQKLEDYRRRHNGELPTQVDANMQGVHNTEMQLQALLDSLNRDRDRRLMVERQLEDLNAVEAAAMEDSAALPVKGAEQSASAQLEEAERALRALQLRLKPEHPDVVRMKRNIAELQRRAEAESAQRPVTTATIVTPAQAARRNRINALRSELADLQRQINYKSSEEQRLRSTLSTYQAHVEAAPVRETELAELTRDYDTLQESYRSLLTKKQESQIAANLERRQIGEQFKILDPARLPERPYSPNRPQLYLLGMLAALGIGLASAMVAEYLDRSLRSEEDVRIALSLPVLATVPLVAAPRHSRRLAMVASLGLAVISGAAAVAWRMLK
jgi:polysaccharide chain length determinant protein (PEP-CTERM system associated)